MRGSEDMTQVKQHGPVDEYLSPARVLCDMSLHAGVWNHHA